MIRKIACAIVIVLVVMAAYLSLWPVPIRAVAWKAPVAPGYTGPHAANTSCALPSGFMRTMLPLAIAA